MIKMDILTLWYLSWFGSLQKRYLTAKVIIFESLKSIEQQDIVLKLTYRWMGGHKRENPCFSKHISLINCEFYKKKKRICNAYYHNSLQEQ